MVQIHPGPPTANGLLRGGATPSLSGPRPSRSLSRHCITATSSQRLNLRPTSRSMPTSSNPQRGVERPRRVAAGLDAGHDGVEADWSRRRRARRSSRSRPMPRPGGRAGRRPSPPPSCGRRPGPCRATARRSRRPRRRRRRTTAEKAPERAASQARCSASGAGHQVERGGRGLDLEVVDGPDRLGVVERAPGAG